MSQNPYSSPTPFDANPMPTIGGLDYLKSFAIFFLMSFVLGAVAGFVVGAIAGAVLGGAGADLQTIQLVGGALGFLVSIPVDFVCFQFAVRKFIVEKLNPS